MGLLQPKPKLEPGETVRWKALANHADGPSMVMYGMNAASGGKLYVTDRRVLFQPSRVDGLRRGPWACAIADVLGLEVADKDGDDVFAGGLRKRLGIRTADGLELFVVNKLDERLAELRVLLGRP